MSWFFRLTGPGQEGVHAILPGRAAAVKTGPLRLRTPSPGVRAPLCRLKEEVQPHHARRGGL